MKTLGLVLLLMLPAGAAAPGGSAPAAESHGVSVVQTGWHKEFYNPALYEDPMLGSDSATAAQRERKETNKSIDARRTGERMLYKLPPAAEPPEQKISKRAEGSP